MVGAHPSLKLPPPRLARWRTSRRTSQPRERREMTSTTTGCQQPKSYQHERETERGKSPRSPPKGERVRERNLHYARAREGRAGDPAAGHRRRDGEDLRGCSRAETQRRRGDGERGRGVPRRQPRTLPRTRRTERNGNGLMQEGWQA